MNENEIREGMRFAVLCMCLGGCLFCVAVTVLDVYSAIFHRIRNWWRGF